MESLSLNLSPEVWAMIGFAVIAVVKLVDELFNKDWRTVVKIFGAALAGLGIAALVPDVKLFVGALAGLSASGLITTASFISAKNTATISLPDGEVAK
jgi:hypothetical protein